MSCSHNPGFQTNIKGCSLQLYLVILQGNIASSPCDRLSVSIFGNFPSRSFEPKRKENKDMTASPCKPYIYGTPLLMTDTPLFLPYLWVLALRNLKSFWNILKFRSESVGQNDHFVPVVFSFTAQLDTFLVSKVHSLQLKLFSWSWFDLKFFVAF